MRQQQQMWQQQQEQMRLNQQRGARYLQEKRKREEEIRNEEAQRFGVGSNLLSSQTEYSQRARRFATTGYRLAPKSHPVRGVVVLVVCLGLTLVFGLFVGSASESLLVATGAWIIGGFVTIGLTSRAWQGE
jgi:hypothetical protein